MVKPLLMVVMDGVGISPFTDGDAVQKAHTPNLDRLAKGPMCELLAHGPAVGMPSWGDMGNSEVGHNALGSGQIYDQGAKLVQNAINSGSVFEGEVWKKVVHQAIEGKLHFLGLLSDGNVHSHIDHLIALSQKAFSLGARRQRFHILLDGRDVQDGSSLHYVERLEAHISQLKQNGGDLQIASGGGRMHITMDRYGADWAMVERGWKTHVLGEARKFASASEAIQTFRQENPEVSDQYLPSFVVADPEPVGLVEDGDSLVLFNFRGDRAMEISQAFENGPDFEFFDRQRVPKIEFAGMMQYDGDLQIPNRFLVDPPQIEHTLTEQLVLAGLNQFAISETQKFGHVTYFWNGNRSEVFDAARETYCEIPSDLGPVELRPWMKASEITESLIAALESESYDFLRVNYANGDMVGHSGDFDAAVNAVSCVDLQIGRLLKVIKKMDGIALITADHGNAEEMFQLNKDGSAKLDDLGKPIPKTSHTLNKVPLYLFNAHNISLVPHEKAGLANIAATVTDLLGLRSHPAWEPSLVRTNS